MELRSQNLEDELFEILWRKGPVYHQLHGGSPSLQLPAPPAGGWAEPVEAAARLSMEEDEMAAWLHYPAGDTEDRGAAIVAEPIPEPPPPPVMPENESHLDRVKGWGESAVVGSSETAAKGEQAVAAATARCEPADKKRKARAEYDFGSVSEEAKFKYGDKRKEGHRTVSTRRARAAEVHNLSERRRRDRINEKMKALQELIPRCNKSDKASMLDETIEYVKSLQLQIQMMSMGCNMGPMMYPGVQAYMPQMGMGMNSMGMGLAMRPEMAHVGMGRPMIPFGAVLPCHPIVGHSPAHLVPSVPPFHLSSVTTADQLRAQASDLQDSASNSSGTQVPNMVRIPNATGPYHGCVSIHQLSKSSIG